MPEMEWVDELPGEPYEKLSPQRKSYRPREQSQDLHDHAIQLIRNPMRWAKYPRPLKTADSAQRTANAVREGTLAAYSPKLGFQVASRHGACYIRYNPDAMDPHKVAWNEGYEKGRKDAMSEVATALWDFRAVLSKIEGWRTYDRQQ